MDSGAIVSLYLTGLIIVLFDNVRDTHLEVFIFVLFFLFQRFKFLRLVVVNGFKLCRSLAFKKEFTIQFVFNGFPGRFNSLP